MHTCIIYHIRNAAVDIMGGQTPSIACGPPSLGPHCAVREPPADDDACPAWWGQPAVGRGQAAAAAHHGPLVERLQLQALQHGLGVVEHLGRADLWVWMAPAHDRTHSSARVISPRPASQPASQPARPRAPRAAPGELSQVN
jgi:hypothetical protein